MQTIRVHTPTYTHTVIKSISTPKILQTWSTTKESPCAVDAYFRFTNMARTSSYDPLVPYNIITWAPIPAIPARGRRDVYKL